MKRTFNYTGRIRLSKDNIRLALAAAGESVQVNGFVRLDDISSYPEAARALLYFKRGPARATIDLGRVRPELRVAELLPDFTDPEGISVDLRIVNSASPARKVLALARNIRAGLGDETAKRSLLTTRRGDFELPVWRLTVDLTTGPVLEISRRCGDFRKLARSGEFVALVMPVVVKLVAQEILLGPNKYEDDPEEDDDPAGQWLRFMTALPGVDEYRPDLDDDQRRELVQQVEAAFAREADVLTRAAALLLVDGDNE